MMETLKKKYKDWEKWASAADKSENGWQSDYPAWSDLMATAISAMTQKSPSHEDIKYIDKCWAISGEDEELADHVKEHIDPCWDILHQLTRSAYPDTRWQVYEVLGYAGPKGEGLLRKGLLDADSYCKRRALLSLVRLQPDDARQIANQFVQDPDSDMRLASIEMVRVSKDSEFINYMKELLLQDAVAHVRKTAHTLGSP